MRKSLQRVPCCLLPVYMHALVLYSVLYKYSTTLDRWYASVPDAASHCLRPDSIAQSIVSAARTPGVLPDRSHSLSTVS
jgi:hypothetical protein